MIHPTHTAEATETGPTKVAKTFDDVGAATTKSEKAFAAVFADEKRRVRETSSAKPHQHHHVHIEVPKGETWRPVHGNDQYAHITSGPRKGLLINLSAGSRRGLTFHVEYRHGIRVHVYGKGKHEWVILAEEDSGKIPNRHHLRPGEMAHTAHRGPHETWAPVPGHSDYVDILSGPRNGYYLNTSGGERDGMVFHIVHRHGQEYHIYGHGKDRQVVLVKHKHHHSDPAHKVDPAEKPTTTDENLSPGSPETGGAVPS